MTIFLFTILTRYENGWEAMVSGALQAVLVMALFGLGSLVVRLFKGRKDK